MRRDRPRTLVRLTAAADELSVPRGTVRAWASEPNRKLWPVGLDDEDIALYDLDAVRALAAATPRRRRRSA